MLEGSRPLLDGAQIRYRDKLRERLDRLDVQAEPERLEQELALIAQRVDVAEEVDRLEGHVAEIRATLARAEPIGRRLDFLIQELNREANTFASKVQDETLTRDGRRAQGADRADARAGAKPRMSASKRAPRRAKPSTRAKRTGPTKSAAKRAAPGAKPERAEAGNRARKTAPLRGRAAAGAARGGLWVIAAPSGAGKTTLVRKLLERDPTSPVLDLVHDPCSRASPKRTAVTTSS